MEFESLHLCLNCKRRNKLPTHQNVNSNHAGYRSNTKASETQEKEKQMKDLIIEMNEKIKLSEASREKLTEELKTAANVLS